MLAHDLRVGGVVAPGHSEAGRVPGGVPRGRAGQPRRLEARVAAPALRAAGAEDLRRLRLVGGVVAGGARARGPALALVPRPPRGPRADGRRRHGQDPHGERAVPARVRRAARGPLLHRLVARDAPEAGARGGQARPRDVPALPRPPARDRRARLPAARRRRGPPGVPGVRRRLRAAERGHHHQPRVQPLGLGVRRRPDGGRRHRPRRPPRAAGPVPGRVLPSEARPHAGGAGAQKACARIVRRLLNFRCSFRSKKLDETHASTVSSGWGSWSASRTAP